jgi:hypothetical protein
MTAVSRATVSGNSPHRAPTQSTGVTKSTLRAGVGFSLKSITFLKVRAGGYCLDLTLPQEWEKPDIRLLIWKDVISSSLVGRAVAQIHPHALVPIRKDDRSLRAAPHPKSPQATIYSHSFIHFENLRLILRCCAFFGWWGRTLHVRAVKIDTGGIISAETGSRTLLAPVKPLPTPLTPRAVVEAPGVTYPIEQGVLDNKKGRYKLIPAGRLLTTQAIDGHHYFLHGGRFETDPEKRGLDCITFARSVLGVPDHLAGPSQHSDKLAAYLRDVHCAEDCGLEKGDYASLAKFAENRSAGRYMIWTDSHVVILEMGVIYEFTPKSGLSMDDEDEMPDYLARTRESRKGFATPAAEWLEQQKKLRKKYSALRIIDRPSAV